MRTAYLDVSLVQDYLWQKSTRFVNSHILNVECNETCIDYRLNFLRVITVQLYYIQSIVSRSFAQKTNVLNATSTHVNNWVSFIQQQLQLPVKNCRNLQWRSSRKMKICSANLKPILHQVLVKLNPINRIQIASNMNLTQNSQMNLTGIWFWILIQRRCLTIHCYFGKNNHNNFHCYRSWQSKFTLFQRRLRASKDSFQLQDW